MDRFNGVTVSVPAGMEAEEFASSLRQSLTEWQNEGRRGIWITVQPGEGALIPIALGCGFAMHHVNDDGSLTLTRWLEKSESQLPRHATHQVGVGGLVLHPDGKRVLVVCEKYDEGKERYKLPGGLVDPGELMAAAAERDGHSATAGGAARLGSAPVSIVHRDAGGEHPDRLADHQRSRWVAAGMD